eukprot:g6274.t1
MSQRLTFIAQLRPGMGPAYRSMHDRIYPEVAAGLRAAGIKQLNIYQKPQSETLVMVIDTAGNVDLSKATGPGSNYRMNPRCKEWEELMDGEYHTGWTQLEEIHSSDVHWNRALQIPSVQPSGASNFTKLSNGLKMPLVGLGTWKSEPGAVSNAVKVAIESGVRHIDAASVYGNEKEVGEGIKAGLASLGSGCSRSDLFVTSKLWNTKHAPKDVYPACKKTLDDLGLDYLDLYLIHWPISFQAPESDPEVAFPKEADGRITYAHWPLLETWRAMEELVEKGLVRSIGVSNFNKKQVDSICSSKNTKIQPVVNQVESHPWLLQKDLIDFCHNKCPSKVQVEAYSPLGSGLQKFLEDERVVAIAEKHGKNVGQILIRFQVQRGVVVIPKSTNPGRIKGNSPSSILDFSLSEEEMSVLESFEAQTRIRTCVPMVTLSDGTKEPRDLKHPEFPFPEEFTC